MCPSSGDLLPLEALSADGVGVLHSGALVRWIEVSPVNPLIHDTEGAEGISRAFTSIAARLPDDRQSLQLIAQATPLPVEAILAAEREDCHSAADDARSRQLGAAGRRCRATGTRTGTVDPHSEPGARGARAALLRGRALAAGASGNRSAALTAPRRTADAHPGGVRARRARKRPPHRGNPHRP